MGPQTSDIDLARVVAETPDGVLGVTFEGEIIFANSAADSIFGYPAGGLLGLSVESVLEVGPWFFDAVAPKYSGASAVSVSARRADASVRAVELSVASHGNGNGEHGARFVSVIVRPVPEGERASSAAVIAAEREAFLAMAAHQLRSPIQPILVSLRTIERALASRAPLPEDTLPRALRQAMRLGRLVDAILRDVAAPDGEPASVTMTRFDLSAFIGALVDDYRLAYPGRVFGYEAPAEGLGIVSDRDRVDEILVALIDNAIRYSPRERPVLIELRATGSGPSVRVTDEGIGVPAAECERIFAKYFRGSNVRRATAGLGMGLYIARNLAGRLHGDLAVVGAPGSGSTFVLTLPWSSSKSPPLSRVAEGGVHGQVGRR